MELRLRVMAALNLCGYVYETDQAIGVEAPYLAFVMNERASDVTEALHFLEQQGYAQHEKDGELLYYNPTLLGISWLMATMHEHLKGQGDERETPDHGEAASGAAVTEQDGFRQGDTDRD